MSSGTYLPFNMFKRCCLYSCTAVIVILLGILVFSLANVVLTNAKLYDEDSPVGFNVQYSHLASSESLNDVASILNQPDKFKSANASKFPFRLGSETYWVMININNYLNIKQDMILYADNNFLTHFDTYHVDLKKQKIIRHFDQASNMNSTTFPHYTMTLPRETAITLLVRLKSNGPPSIPLKVLTADAFDTITTLNTVIYGIFIGGVLVMALYNLILFFVIKDTVYLTYIGYLLSAFLVMSTISGFASQIFPPSLSALIKAHFISLHYLLVGFLLVFTITFLRFDPKTSRLYKLVVSYIVILLCLHIATLTQPHESQATWFFALQPMSYAIGIVALTHRLRAKFVWAKYYVISWLPLLVGSAIQPLVLLGYLESSFITRNAFMIAIFIEIILMSFALAERVRRLEHERVQAISFHQMTGIPRKSTIEAKISQFIKQKYEHFSVVVIAPEEISKLSSYAENATKYDFLTKAATKLNSLFRINNAIVPLFGNSRKVCIINDNLLALLIDHTRADQQIETLCVSIRQILAQCYTKDPRYLSISSHIGIASYPKHGLTAHALLTNAMQAAHDAQLHITSWSYFEGQTPDEFNALMQLANDLKAALEHGGLTLYHQPQVDLKTRQVCSSECLLRWQHPTKGEISPKLFVLLAENTGLINDLTLWVIRQALTQQTFINEQHGSNQMLSININVKDLMYEKFLVNIIILLEEFNVSPEKIIFEVTHPFDIKNNEKAMYNMTQLRELGITMSTSDFGASYSQLLECKHYPYQEFKIHRDLTNEILMSKAKQSTAKALVIQAKALGLEVAAEGITNEQEEQFLRELGCDIGQGYFYAKSMPIEDYLFWLSRLVNGKASATLTGEFIAKQVDN